MRWTQLVRALAATERGTPIALFRIALGLTVLAELASVVHRAYVPLWRDPAHGGLFPLGDHHWLLQLTGTSPTAVDALFVTTVLASTALVCGVGGRLGALVAMATFPALCGLHPEAGGSHDRLITIALWLLALSRCDETLSMWCKARTGRFTSDRPIPAWPRYLLVFQLVVVYTFTGLVKMGASWWPAGHYRAVYLSLLQPAWARFDLWWMAWLEPLTQVATAVTWWWEFTWWMVPLWLWQRARGAAWTRKVDVRLVYVGLGVVMHGTLWVLTSLGPFSPLMLSLYLPLFHADEYDAARKRFGRDKSVGATIPDDPEIEASAPAEAVTR